MIGKRSQGGTAKRGKPGGRRSGAATVLRNRDGCAVSCSLPDGWGGAYDRVIPVMGFP